MRRIVYLGGLTPRGVPERTLSPHLRSRAEVGPILVRDVLHYLAGAATMPDDIDRAFDVGGPDVPTYREMMRRHATVSGLRRRIIVPAPVLTPGLSSHWVGLVTPVPASIARPLTESLRHEVVCQEHDIARYVPDAPGRPLPFDVALTLALRRVREAQVATRWSSASVPGAPSDPLPTDPDWAGGSLYEDERHLPVDASPEALWKVVEGIGGDNGWYSFPPAWAVRGWLDRFVGGVGLRRGRRDAQRLHPARPVAWRGGRRRGHRRLAGRTGYPVVDAAMRQLRHQGWMHNRARLLVASFLTKTLYVDWRIGARHFLDLLVDGDVVNNQLNWQWAAGTGTDTRPHRVLNPLVQARRFDPDGVYVRRWVPELRSVEGGKVHEPWRLAAAERGELDYPDPLVELADGLARFKHARGRD